MKKVLFTLAALLVSVAAMAQNATTQDEMMRQWRQMHHKRTVNPQTALANIPAGEVAPQAKNSKALPDDRIWFPGEWEEVKAIVVTPYYTYLPDSNLGVGQYSADPVVTGVAEYFQYNPSRGWVSMNTYGPYRSVMDTNGSFGRVSFRLMDGIQRGHRGSRVRASL